MFNVARHSHSSWGWITVEIQQSCEPVKWFTCIICYYIKSCFLHVLVVVMRGSHVLPPKHEIDWHGNIYQERSFFSPSAISMKICFCFCFTFPFLFFYFLFLPSFFSLKNRKAQVVENRETSLSHKALLILHNWWEFYGLLEDRNTSPWRGHTCLHWSEMSELLTVLCDSDTFAVVTTIKLFLWINSDVFSSGFVRTGKKNTKFPNHIMLLV